MSDDKENNYETAKPIKKTSAVPLRKETVRVTLKAPAAKPGNLPANVIISEDTGPSPTLDLSATNKVQERQPAPAAPGSLAAPSVPKPMPLKHETMRVTLKADTSSVKNTPANPSGVASAPDIATPATASVAPMAPVIKSPQGPTTAPIVPGAPSAAGAPPAPSAPSGPTTTPITPPVPAATIPLGGASTPPKAPGAPQVASPAPTMKLGSTTGPATAPATMNLGSASPTVPLATVPLGAAASQPLPKATVQLQQTQPLTQGLGTPTQAAMIQTVVADEDNRGGAGAALPLSIVAFVLSLIVLYFQFTHAKIWVDAHEDGELMTIFEGVDS